MLTRPNERKEYRINDHLGTPRITIDESGRVIGTLDTEPFGAPLAVAGVDPRKGFIDREEDTESGTYNTGVRQYDAEIGAFPSTDVLYEQFRGHSPYHYSFLNPLAYKDPSGKNGVPVPGPVGIAVEVAGGAYDLYDAVETVTDPNKSVLEKTLTVVGASSGMILPGAGYGTVMRVGVDYVDEAFSYLSKAFSKSDNLIDAGKAAKSNRVAVKDLKPIHSLETSGERPELRKLSDEELMESVVRPNDGRMLQINVRTGGLMDGNGRAYELMRRALLPGSAITPETLVPVELFGKPMF